MVIVKQQKFLQVLESAHNVLKRLCMGNKIAEFDADFKSP